MVQPIDRSVIQDSSVTGLPVNMPVPKVIVLQNPIGQDLLAQINAAIDANFSSLVPDVSTQGVHGPIATVALSPDGTSATITLDYRLLFPNDGSAPTFGLLPQPVTLTTMASKSGVTINDIINAMVNYLVPPPNTGGGGGAA